MTPGSNASCSGLSSGSSKPSLCSVEALEIMMGLPSKKRLAVKWREETLDAVRDLRVGPV
jgi:hypothetical protein